MKDPVLPLHTFRIPLDSLGFLRVPFRFFKGPYCSLEFLELLLGSLKVLRFPKGSLRFFRFVRDFSKLLRVVVLRVPWGFIGIVRSPGIVVLNDIQTC